jgi:hypothetical protein
VVEKQKSPELLTQGWIEIRWLEVRDYPCPELGPIMIAAIRIDWTEILRIVRVRKYRAGINSQVLCLEIATLSPQDFPAPVVLKVIDLAWTTRKLIPPVSRAVGSSCWPAWRFA